MGPSPALVLTLTLTLTLPLTQVGPSPALIRRAAALPCRLAWSVHAADNALRRALVPTTRHTMEELREAFSAALAAKSDPKQRGLLVEVALLAGVNDQLDHAEALAAFLQPFQRGEVLVNLIPYNENGLGLRPGEPFGRPALEDVRAFQRRLWTHAILCTVRVQRGDDESSACGQLVVEVEGRQAGRRSPRPGSAQGEEDKHGRAAHGGRAPNGAL